MNVFEQAIIQAANSTMPGAQGWKTVQDWKAAAVEGIERRERMLLESPCGHHTCISLYTNGTRRGLHGRDGHTSYSSEQEAGAFTLSTRTAASRSHERKRLPFESSA